jgi:hypothetical protein
VETVTVTTAGFAPARIGSITFDTLGPGRRDDVVAELNPRLTISKIGEALANVWALPSGSRGGGRICTGLHCVANG